MNFQFFNTPKPRKFNYKPRFYDPEKEGDVKKEGDDFASTLHRSWNKTRTRKEPHKFPIKSVIWISLIIITLIYLYYKFIVV